MHRGSAPPGSPSWSRPLAAARAAHNGQLEAISWGEEKPKSLGHDEAAWAENRRVDLVYPNH